MNELENYKANGVIFDYQISNNVCWLTFSKPNHYDVAVKGSNFDDCIQKGIEYIKLLGDGK